MIRRLLKFWPVLVFLLYFGLVYRQFIFKGLLPIPSDTVVGLYYPWRDSMEQYPNGVPFKNSLITDAVRQEYPWRQLAIEQIKQGKWPSWNPYSFSGYPLAANLQSAPLYPLNIIYFLKDFPLAWSIQILLQTLLGGTLMAIFLRNLKLSKEAVLMGTIAWVGCGFFISWLETNMVVQSVTWLPLILFSIDRLSVDKKPWPTMLIALGLVSSFLAGHLQTTFYVVAVACFYCLFRCYEKRSFIPFAYTTLSTALAAIIALPILIPAAQFIQLSGRGLDQAVWNKPDWFLPWQNLVQFIAPDYFGNPATLNYFGVWNYAEFVGYIGLAAIIFGLAAIIARKKETWIFIVILAISLLFALPTPLAKIPFQFNWPLISSSQPSRLIVIVSFSLSVLAAFGLNHFQKEKKMRPLFISLGVLLVGFFVSAIIAAANHWVISLRNLVLPSALLLATGSLVILATFSSRLKKIVVIGLLLLLSLDNARFADKFLSFTPREWLFAPTKIMTFLADKAKTDIFRVTASEDTTLPDNFSVPYKIQTASGYDPLYLLRYAEFMVAIDRNRPDIAPPFNFNRTIRARSIDNRLYPLLNVRYVLSPNEMIDPKLNLVAQEGNARLYETKNYLPRTFFVEKTIPVTNKTAAITTMFSSDFDPVKMAVVEENFSKNVWSVGVSKIVKYEPNDVTIETNNDSDGFLVLTDAYYPSWHVEINNLPARILITDYAFRGVIVPAGHQIVRFWTEIF